MQIIIYTHIIYFSITKLATAKMVNLLGITGSMQISQKLFQILEFYLNQCTEKNFATKRCILEGFYWSLLLKCFSHFEEV